MEVVETTEQEIAAAMRALVFVGSTSGEVPVASAGALAPTLEHQCSVEVARLDDRLRVRSRGLPSVLALDVHHEPEHSAQAVVAALGKALPADCTPCLTLVPVEPGALARRGVAFQAVSTGDPVIPADGPRFPESAYAGPVVAVAGQLAPQGEGIVAQTKMVMDRVGELLARYGATFDDTVRFNVFYRGDGTMDDWAVNARERARYFTEPGPATTGVPVGELPEPNALILVRTIAVRHARAFGLRAHSWPEGHWDWPIHLPYKHGCDCSGVSFVGGQVSLTPAAEVIDPGQLDVQTRRALRNILMVIGLLGKDAANVLRLTAFYQHRDAESRVTVERVLREELGYPDVEITLVGLRELAYKGMIVEVEAEAR